jgi:hypothetical protein
MSKTNLLERSFADLESHIGHFSVETLASQLPPKLIQEVLDETEKNSVRIRRLPASLTTWLLVGMGLFRSLSICNVYKRLREGFRGGLAAAGLKPPTSGAFIKARDRLGVNPMRLLFERFCRHLGQKFEVEHRWKGFRLVAFDGTTAKVPDSKANRKAFGAPGSGRGRSGYPFVRLMCLLAVQTHLVMAASVGGWNTAEIPLALKLIAEVTPGSLVLLDRGFLSYLLLWRIRQQRSHFLIRARKRLNLKKVRRLAPADWLVRAILPPGLRRKHPELPEFLWMRLIHYRVAGFRPCRLLCSVLNAPRFRAQELVNLYHMRWEQELAYDEIKTHMASVAILFRSFKPQRIKQEAYGLLLAYNIVRSLMAEAATRQDLCPLELSFVDSLACIQQVCLLMAVAPALRLPQLYDQLLKDIATCRLPKRRKRRYPRAVKVKMSSYALKR